MLRNSDQAKDMVQDTYVKLWEHRATIRIETVKSWLFTTAYHQMINFVKRHKRFDPLEEINEEKFSVPSYEHQLEHRELLEIAIDRLPEIQKSILLLRDLEGYNYKEIGEMLSINEPQVKVYLFRARQKIKEYFNAHHYQS
jgi:RNA polymerase sigma factor (sigma-70 family)